MISSQNLRVSWEPVDLQDCVWDNLLPNNHEDHIAGKETTHCNIKIWFTNLFLMPQAMKIPAAKAAVDKEWEKLEKITGVEPDQSQK